MPDTIATTAANPSDTAALVQQFKEMFGTDVVELSVGDRKSVVLVRPTGRTVESVKKHLDEYLVKPERRRGTATFKDVDSFIAHLQRFSSEASAVFAQPDPEKPFLASVIDYYPISQDPTATDWLGHRGYYEPELSEAWKDWLEKNGEPMPAPEFAAFIEDHIVDVIVPNLDDPNLKTFADLVQGRFADPSALMQLSRGLQINIDVQVKNAVTLQTGEISMIYEETHKDGAGQPISIANLFQICIPVFYAGTLYRIAARLRYRQVSGRIHWIYQLVRPDLVFDDAFKGIVQKVRDDGQRPVFLGLPESAAANH